MEGGDTVDPKSAGRAAVAMVGGGPSPAAMSREEIDGRISQIQGSLSSSKVLTKADVDFLGQIDRTHPGYFEAHRLLAEYHFRNKDYKRQAEELEVATSSGKYKRDPTILLSLAKSYAQQQRYSRALSTMQRVDENSRNLPANQKADSYRFYAEMYEFEFMRQYHDDAKKANVSLLDKAITMWERYSTFSKGADPGGVAHAEQKLKKLEEMKNGLEL
jgi:tetratricopeptide (TPR) repeat protein